jgi:thymidylate synthase (FAD)
VGAESVRFVERREYQGDPMLHSRFEARIDNAVAEYTELTAALLKLQGEGYDPLRGDSKRDARKHVQQVARSCLPNETEAPILVTGNLRAWRHCLEMRASEHADTAIRQPFVEAFKVLRGYAPSVFSDFSEHVAPDGLPCLTAKYRKV